MDIDKLNTAKAIRKEIDDLIAHKMEIINSKPKSGIENYVPMIFNSSQAIKVTLRDEFMLLPIRKTLEMYIDSVHKRIDELEKQFAEL
jgi:hypothetical protein